MDETAYVVSMQCGWYSMYNSGFQESRRGLCCGSVAAVRLVCGLVVGRSEMPLPRRS
jgi:hypothetical protein